jgi:hypothetical protein
MERNQEGHSPKYWRKHPEAVRPPKRETLENKAGPQPERRWEWAHTLAFLGVAVGIGGLLFPPGSPEAFIAWLVVLFSCLVYPFLHFSRIVLSFAASKVAYTISMVVLVSSIAVVGIKNFPKPAYYHVLSKKERNKFIEILKSQKTSRHIVRVACPPNNEDLCVVAKEYAELFQWGDWRIEGPAVQRATLSKPMAGVVLEQHSTGPGTPDDPRTGVWTQVTDSATTITAAFKSVDITVDPQGDFTMPEGTIGVYFGPAPH